MWDQSKIAGRVATAAAAALIVAAVFGAPSAGAAKVISKSKSITIAGTNTVGSAVAKCPRRLAAVGGGFSSTPQLKASPPSLMNVHESQRAGLRGWRVSAAQTATNGSGRLTAYVYCRKQRPPIKEISDSQTLPTAARSQATALASCPKGAKAVAGGFALPAAQGASTAFPTDSEKSGGRNWTVTGVRDNDPAGSAGSVEAIAYCVRNAPAKTKAATEEFTTNENQDVTATAKTPACKRPARPSSGGFNAPFAVRNNDRAATLVTESRRVGSSWQATGYGLGPSGIKLALTAFGYCR